MILIYLKKKNKKLLLFKQTLGLCIYARTYLKNNIIIYFIIFFIKKYLNSRIKIIPYFYHFRENSLIVEFDESRVEFFFLSYFFFEVFSI